MARGINKVILIGNAGNDAEVRFMPNGGAVANVSLATSESWRDKQTGQMQERTEWHRVSFMDRGNFRLGQIAGDFIKKGSKVYVEGSLRTREWEKDGVKRYTTEIIANEMQLLDGRNDQGGQGAYDNNNQGGYGQAPQPRPASQPQGGYGNQQPNQGYGQQPAGGYGQAPQQAPQQSAPAQPQSFGSWGDAPQPASQQPAQRPSAPAPQPSAPKPQAAPQPAPNFDDFDDDIPF